jgi:hypothetical protein
MVTWIHGGHGDIGNVIEGFGFSVNMGISIYMQIRGRVLAGTFISHTINNEGIWTSRNAFIKESKI